MENKSASINALLMCLREDIGRENFDIIDNSGGDPLAIGISKKSDQGGLAIISVNEKEPIYSVALELASVTKEYEPVGKYENLKYETLLQIVRTHLGLE